MRTRSGQLTSHRTVAAVQKKIATQGKRNVVSQVFHAKSDKDAIAVWRQDLVRVHHVFNVRRVEFRVAFTDIFLSDRVGNQYTRHGCGHPPEHVGKR